MGAYRIVGDTTSYILERLRFAPCEARALRQHMRRRKDFKDVVKRLVAAEIIYVRGAGVKGEPIMYILNEAYRRVEHPNGYQFE